MELITCREADRLLKLRNGTVSRAIKAGELQGYVKPGGKWARVNPEDLDDWQRKAWALPKQRPTA